MAINVTKPAINLREKLNEVTLETGIKGEDLLNSDTSTEARNVLELDTHLFTDFESTGIDDNATSTAITIDANENVGVGVLSPSTKLHLLDNTANDGPMVRLQGSGVNAAHNLLGGIEVFNGDSSSNGPQVVCNIKAFSRYTSGRGGYLTFGTNTGTAGAEGSEPTEVLRLESDGRGLSQFTAKAWVNFNGTGTVAIRDSHNVSSIGDNGIGDYTVNFSNNMASANYAGAGLAANDGESLSYRGGIGWTSASYSRIAHKSLSNSYIDGSLITFIVFGD